MQFYVRGLGLGDKRNLGARGSIPLQNKAWQGYVRALSFDGWELDLISALTKHVSHLLTIPQGVGRGGVGKPEELPSPSGSNSLGFIGVSFHSLGRGWRARIQVRSFKVTNVVLL